MFLPPLHKIFPHIALGEYVQKQYVYIVDRLYLRYRDMKTGAFITRGRYNLMRGIIGYHNKLRAFRRAKPELTYTEARKGLRELRENYELGYIDREEFIREISP